MPGGTPLIRNPRSTGRVMFHGKVTAAIATAYRSRAGIGMGVQITLQLTGDLAREVQEGKSSIVEVVQQLGLRIEQLHPETPDPLLKRFFIMQVHNAADAEKVMSQLRQCHGVEAAYVKPPGEPP